MSSNPFAGLLRSRKFWLLVLDTIVSLVLFFVGRYAGGVLEDVNFVILAIQPVVIAVILGIAWEDSAAKRNGQ